MRSSSSSSEEAKLENPALANAKWWVAIWETVEHWAFLGVVITLAIEFAAAHFVKAPRRVVEAAHATELALLNKQASEAQLELAKIKTPRVITDEQKNLLSFAMAEYKGTPFDFAIQPDDETAALMVSLGDTLEKAGLRWVRWDDLETGPISIFTKPGHPPAGIIALTGISVQINDNKTIAWEMAVRTLTSALQGCGFEKVTSMHTIDNSENMKAIHIYIGRKPT